jgi:hypothetical protein
MKWCIRKLFTEGWNNDPEMEFPTWRERIAADVLHGWAEYYNADYYPDNGLMFDVNMDISFEDDDNNTINISDIQTSTNNYMQLSIAYDKDHDRWEIYATSDGLPTEFRNAVHDNMMERYKFKLKGSWVARYAAGDNINAFEKFIQSVINEYVSERATIHVSFDMKPFIDEDSNTEDEDE